MTDAARKGVMVMVMILLEMSHAQTMPRQMTIAAIFDQGGDPKHELAFRHAVQDYNKGSEYKINQKHLAYIRQMLTSSYGEKVIESEEKLSLYTDWIVECVQKSDYISVFDIRIDSNLDYVILSSLLRYFITDFNVY